MRKILLGILCSVVVIGNLHAVLIDEDVYNWTGWSARNDFGDYIGSGFKSAQAPGENPVYTNNITE